MALGLGAAAIGAGGSLLTGLLQSFAAQAAARRKAEMEAAIQGGKLKSQAAQSLGAGQSGALGQLIQGFRGALL